MAQLVPHLLFRTDSLGSELAVSLRDAGYMVTRVTDDDTAVRAASLDHVDGIVLQLSAGASSSLVRKLQPVMGGSLPILITTSTPAVIRRACPGAEIFDTNRFDSDIVSTTDLMLARHQRYPLAKAS